MALEALMRQLAYEPVGHDLPTMFDLPSENPEEPGLPDVFHPLQAFLLSLTFRIDGPRFTALDLNLYYDERNTQRYIRPDWFVTLGAPSSFEGEIRRSYVVWQEKIKPFLVVELLSPGSEGDDLGLRKTKPTDRPTKWEVYESILEVPYYIVYDRYRDNFVPHVSKSEGYLPMPIRDGLVTIPEVSLKLGTWHGIFEGQEANWLRWYDMDGFMIPTPEEYERAEKERERAEKDVERAAKERERKEKENALSALERAHELLRKAGIDPDQVP
jgi:Uma2 family endonuclease